MALRIGKLINVGGHFLFWGVVFVLFCPEPLGMGAFSLKLFGQRETLLFFLYGFFLNLLLFYGFANWGMPRLLGRNWVLRLLWRNLVWLAGFVMAESLLDTWFGYWAGGVAGDLRTARNVGGWIPTNLALNGGMLLMANVYGFAAAWFRDRQVQRDLEQEKLRAELLALKHQINPHFLFNVLNSLYGLAFRNNDEPTAEGIAKLSLLMRYMLYDSNDTEVPLEKELDHLEHYIALQRLRLDQQTEIRMEVTGEISGRQIAPMLLIPFVENAFKFGISTAHASFVWISMAVEPRQMVFSVRNSWHEVNTPAREEVGGIGLDNVKKRLELLYPASYDLSIQPGMHDFFIQLNIRI